jgi:hypothetical protein
MNAIDERFARYGLRGNPFRNPSTNSVASVHANLGIDDILATYKENVFLKKQSHGVLLIGDTGMGKTHRVYVADIEASTNNMFSRKICLLSQGRSAMNQFLSNFIPKGSALFSNDKWQRELSKIKKQVKTGSYDPQMVASHVAEALNKKTPSFVLIDDLDKIQILSDQQYFLEFLFQLLNRIQPGVFFLITMNASYASWLLQKYPNAKDLFAIQYLTMLQADEATAVVSKWLGSYRLVDNINPLFPFSTKAVHLLNAQGHGSINALLDLSDMALTAASYQKAVVITDQFVKDTLITVQQQRPQLLFEKRKQAQPSVEIQQLIQQPYPVGDQRLIHRGSSIVPIPVLSADILEEEIEEEDEVLSQMDVQEKRYDKGSSPKQDETVSELEPIDEDHIEESQIDLFKGEQQDTLTSKSYLESSPDDVTSIPADSPAHPTPSDGNMPLVEEPCDHIVKDEWTRMKDQHRVDTSDKDNGSRTKSTDPASIMHQVKQQKKQKEEVIEDEPDESSHLSDENQDLDIWEPIIETDDAKSDDVEPQKQKGQNVEKKKGKQKKEPQKKDKKQTASQKKDISQSKDTDKETGLTDETVEDNCALEKDPMEPEWIDPKSNQEAVETNLPKRIVSQRKMVPDTIKTQQNKPEISSRKRIVRVRCPECTKDFTIEIDEHTHTLTCPFCDFTGEL